MFYVSKLASSFFGKINTRGRQSRAPARVSAPEASGIVGDSCGGRARAGAQPQTKGELIPGRQSTSFQPSRKPKPADRRRVTAFDPGGASSSRGAASRRLTINLIPGRESADRRRLTGVELRAVARPQAG